MGGIDCLVRQSDHSRPFRYEPLASGPIASCCYHSHTPFPWPSVGCLTLIPPSYVSPIYIKLFVRSATPPFPPLPSYCELAQSSAASFQAQPQPPLQTAHPRKCNRPSKTGFLGVGDTTSSIHGPYILHWLLEKPYNRPCSSLCPLEKNLLTLQPCVRCGLLEKCLRCIFWCCCISREVP